MVFGGRYFCCRSFHQRALCLVRIIHKTSPWSRSVRMKQLHRPSPMMSVPVVLSSSLRTTWRDGHDHLSGLSVGVASVQRETRVPEGKSRRHSSQLRLMLIALAHKILERRRLREGRSVREGRTSGHSRGGPILDSAICSHRCNANRFETPTRHDRTR